MKNIKDNLTNWLALVVLILQGAYVVIENWINGAPFDWKQLIGAVILAIILWVTGKTANLKKKTPDQVKKNVGLEP